VPARKTTDGRTADGKWIDRWAESGRKRQRTFDRKGDRDAFRDRRRRAQQLGREVASELMLDDDLTLNAWMEDWWARHAIPNLEKQTRINYKRAWGKWIQPRLGSYELRALTPRVINTQLVQAMRGAGAGEPTVRVALALLQSILRLAVTEERIASNPVGLIEKPSSLPDAGLDPIAPATVETMRRAAIARRGSLGVVDAFIVGVLAYAGLRPQELLALHWEDVLGDEAKLFVARKNVDGQLFPYLKSGRKRRNRRHRRVDLFESLAADFRAHRLSSGRRAGLVIARPDGAPWRKHDWDNWRERVWQPLAVHAGLGRYVKRQGRPALYDGPPPYDLRGSFVSLLVWEGRTMLEVAGQAGHGVDVCELYYARIFEGYEPAGRTSAEQAIRAARQLEGRAMDAIRGEIPIGATQ
jgi:integrase